MIQKTKNKKSTRYYSNLQEEYVAKLLNGVKTANSGATNFSKGDVKIKVASTLIECKTCTKEKDSFSIKKEWLEKNKQEAKLTHYTNSVLAFNFGPETDNYFIIDENLMKYLIQQLENEYK